MPFDVSQYWVISIIAPAIMLIVLIWLVMKRRSTRKPGEHDQTEAATRKAYAEEEIRRREGTDQAEK